MLKLNSKRITQTLVASASILSFGISFSTPNLSALAQISANPNDPRWYANSECGNYQGLAAAKVSQSVVNTLIDPADASVGGFVAHPLWLGTGTGAWVEVGYDKEPARSEDTAYYWASYTPTSATYIVKGYVAIGSYKELEIAWNRSTKYWNFYFGGVKIGEAANIGGPSYSGTEAGLESTSDRNYSPRAPVYGLQYATLSNFTWQGCSNPSLYNDPPASIYWVNRPFSAETKMP